MPTRNKQILEVREATFGDSNVESLNQEDFQNSVLRPILKFQNELIMAVFQSYIATHKGHFATFSIDTKIAFIDNTLSKEVVLKNTLKGMIIGLFTSDEFLIYSNNSSHYNKRIMSMLSERIKSQLQLLE
jgi:hypothetical protein